jgi:hypothetical protein
VKNTFTNKGALWGILCISVICGFCSAYRWERSISSLSSPIHVLPRKRECVFSPHVNTIYLTGDFGVSGTKTIYLINEYGVVTDSFRQGSFCLIYGLTIARDSTSLLLSGIDTITAELIISQFSLSGSFIRERRLYTPDDWHYPLSLCHSEDGYIYATGYHNISHDPDWWNHRMLLFKMDTLGNILELKVYNHPFFCEGTTIKNTSDGNLIIAGEYGYDEPYLVKADTNCDTIWTRTYDPFLFIDIEDIATTSDGGFILASNKIVRLDSLGNVLWTYDTVSLRFGVPFYSVYETEEGSFVFGGRGARGMLNSEGECLWIIFDEDLSMIWKCIDVSGDIFLLYQKLHW